MTGWAVWQNEHHGYSPERGEVDHEIFAARMLDDPRFSEYSLVVCEDYRITPQTLKKTWQPFSLWQIGLLHYLCQVHDVEFLLQTAAEAKGFSTDAKLKAMGWYNATSGGHANDALRHLMLALVKEHLLDLRPLLEAG